MGGGASSADDGNFDEMVNEDWKRIHKNGEVYYLNTKTNERRAFLIEELPEEAQNQTKWSELVDATSNQPYYWNSETNETTWEIPHELEEIYKVEEEFYLRQLYKNRDDLNLKCKEHINGWQEIYQSMAAAEKLGNGEPICFYYNTETDKLQYSTPVDVVRNQQKLRAEELQSTWDGDQLLAKMKELNQDIDEEMASLHDRVKAERARQRMKLQEMRKKRKNDAGQNVAPPEAQASATADTILRDLKDRRKKYKVGLKTHIEEQDTYNEDAQWQMWEEIIDPVTGKPYYHNVATGKTQWHMPSGLARAYEGQEQQLLQDFVSSAGVIAKSVGTDDTWEMLYDPTAEKDFVVYRNKKSLEMTAEKPEALIDKELKAKVVKLDQAKKMLNETWDGKRLQKELSKLRNDHEDELVQYASTVQDERKRQREKMRQKLRERQRKKANQGNGKKGGEKGADGGKPPPPRTKDAYLDARNDADLQQANDSFAALMSL
jgi:hypothetical protein